MIIDSVLSQLKLISEKEKKLSDFFIVYDTKTKSVELELIKENREIWKQVRDISKEKNKYIVFNSKEYNIYDIDIVNLFSYSSFIKRKLNYIINDNTANDAYIDWDEQTTIDFSINGFKKDLQKAFNLNNNQMENLLDNCCFDVSTDSEITDLRDELITELTPLDNVKSAFLLEIKENSDKIEKTISENINEIKKNNNLGIKL